jgi:hypothetical protein
VNSYNLFCNLAVNLGSFGCQQNTNSIETCKVITTLVCFLCSAFQITGYLPHLDPLRADAPVMPVLIAFTPARDDAPETPMIRAVQSEVRSSICPPVCLFIYKLASTNSVNFLSLYMWQQGFTGLKKYFREGSVRGSVFNLCSATLGAGALSLPFAFSKAGLALGVSCALALTTFLLERFVTQFPPYFFIPLHCR